MAPQKLIDALVAQWTERVDARVTNGALTTASADALKAQLTLRATSMVNQATAGGMGGAAVGAGRGATGSAGNGCRHGRWCGGRQSRRFRQRQLRWHRPAWRSDAVAD